MKAKKFRTMEDLKDDIPIATLIEHIGGRVLGGYGGTWVPVHCPFVENHNNDDRDASASINPATGQFKCNACGAPRDGMAGDIIDVAKQYLGTDSFSEALVWLREEVA